MAKTILICRWNFDDSIIAKLGNDCIFLYETKVKYFKHVCFQCLDRLKYYKFFQNCLINILIDI